MLSVGQAHAEPMSLRAAVQDMHDASEVLADDGSAGLGYTALGVGVAAIGIGAVHFFGKPRAGRVLSRVQPTVSQAQAGQGVRAGLSWIGAF